MSNTFKEFKNYESSKCPNDYFKFNEFSAKYGGPTKTIQKILTERTINTLAIAIPLTIVTTIVIDVAIVKLKNKKINKKYENKQMLNTVREA